MSSQASFAQKISRAQHGDHCFFARVRDHGELDLPFLDIKNGAARIALRENYVFPGVSRNRPAFANSRQKEFGIEARLGFRIAIRRLRWLSHKGFW